jgi:DNA polymerase-3 subunit alpha
MTDFVHLHVHSEFSLLDGAIRIKDLVARTKALDMGAVAVTDHGNMFGAVKHYLAAVDAGVKPIIGCEVYVAPDSRHNRDYAKNAPIYFHLLLLAEDFIGYKNLVRLVSAGHLEGFYYKPRIDREILAKHKDGLIASSACLKGEPAFWLDKGRDDKAVEAARFYRDLFGDENFFIELQDADLAEQKKVNPGLIDLARDLGLGLIATNDCHYLEKNDARAHDVLLCIGTGKTLAEENRLKFGSHEMYLKSAEEMAALFPDTPEALSNTVLIAERCRLDLPVGLIHFPGYAPANGRTEAEELEHLARQGFSKRLARIKKSGREIDEALYKKRLDYELDVINQMGFPGYFLVVADFIQWAKDRGIPVGPGRGSAAGSLVSYSLGITDLDPIQYGLFFERFLTLERRSMPDIDVDFCVRRRDEVLTYVVDKYSAESVAQIITFGRLQARLVLRDVGRVLGLSYGEVDQIAKLIPNRLGITLEAAVAEEERLRERIAQDPRVAEMVEIAKRLEGLRRHAGTHAAGVVIANGAIVDHVPLYRGRDGETVTQFDMKDVEKIGLIKFDFLGLRNLTVIDDAMKIIRRRDPDFDIAAIPMDDAATFDLLSRGDTTGVFQLESSGMRSLLTRLKPNCFEDVIALVALYRPGPLESGMVDDFVKRKHGQTEVAYPLPQLEPILKETYGVIVYQEQVMQIAQELAGYSLGEGDILRRAMGKKVAAIMAQQRERFLSGSVERGIDSGMAGRLFDLIEKFAGYGFNKSHSAAYALISYQTAYLKAHFPVAFMAALLTSDMNDSDKVVKYMTECREMGVAVRPPDVNESLAQFTVVGDKGDQIRFGLAAVKNVGAAAIEAVIESRQEDGPFQGLFDFCSRVDLRKVNKRVIESLVQAGAFDTVEPNRARLFIAVEEAMARGQAIQREREGGQTSMFDLMSNGGGPAAADGLGENLPDIEDWPPAVRLAREKEALGLYLSGHPLDDFREILADLTDTARLAEVRDGTMVKIGGIIRDKKEITNKAGDRMAFVTLEDLSGTHEVVVFPRVFRECVESLSGEEPVLVTARVRREEESTKLLADQIEVLTQAAARPVVRLVLNLGDWDRRKLSALKKILVGDKGGCRVFLRLDLADAGRVLVALPDLYRVEPGRATLARISEIFGPEVVERHFG